MKKIMAVLLAGVSLVACSQIDSGNVGIESTWGQVKETTLPPGVYNTIFKSVLEVTAKETPIEINELKPKTSDNVTLQDLDITVYYRINPSDAAKIFTRYSGDLTYLNNGDALLGAGLVTRTAREAAYKSISKYSSYEVHTKRTELAADVLDILRKEIQDNSTMKGWFEVTNVIVRNITTDQRLEDAIKASAEVEFQIRKKNQELELTKSEAERRRIEAEGEARANRIIAESLTPELLELRRVQSLNAFAEKGGSNTVIFGNNGATPLVQVK